MDPSSTLETLLHEISNVSNEAHFLLNEIQQSGLKIQDLRDAYDKHEAKECKHIKKHGALEVLPDEDKLTSEAQNQLNDSVRLQEKNCLSANTLLYIVSKHLKKLEVNMELLDVDGLLAPLEVDDQESASEKSTAVKLDRKNSIVVSDKKRRSSSVSSASSYKRKKSVSARGSSSSSSNIKQKKSEKVNNKGEELVSQEEDLDIDVKNDEPDTSINSNGGDDDKTLYCYCQHVSFGEMVACDGHNCKYEWFHYECVGLKEPPKGLWYCTECKKSLSKQKQKKKRQN